MWPFSQSRAWGKAPHLSGRQPVRGLLAPLKSSQLLVPFCFFNKSHNYYLPQRSIWAQVPLLSQLLMQGLLNVRKQYIIPSTHDPEPGFSELILYILFMALRTELRACIQQASNLPLITCKSFSKTAAKKLKIIFIITAKTRIQHKY